MNICTDRMSKRSGKYLLTIFVASLIAMPSAHARLTAQHSQLWSQNSPGIGGITEPGDWFGGSVSACDFNNDGREDLAIGVPQEDLGIPSSTHQGAVNVIYGGYTDTGAGLSSVGSQLLTLSFDAPLDLSPESIDYFGWSLASGDFNGDGYCDLAVGVPRRDVEGQSDAGALYVIYGAASGLDENHKQFFSQADGLIEGDPESFDHFGASLAAGDFDGNGKDDLAVGIPGENIGATEEAGLVIVIYAADDSTGLDSRRNQRWTQGVDLNNSGPEGFDRFGESLATGDFDDDGKDDLVVGVPYENIGDTQDAGVVHVIYGTAAGLNAAGSQVWAQGGQIQDVPEFGDAFGFSLAAGDFDGNGKDDLAVGVPEEDHDGGFGEGVVHVIYGQDNHEGLGDVGNQLLSQAGDILGTPERLDQFGRALTAGDFNADLRDDLVVGTMLEDLGDIENAGVVQVIYGSIDGLSTTGNQYWSQYGGEGGDIPGEPEAYDFLGRAVTAGDFDGNGKDDLAVGAPANNYSNSGGEVSVIYAMKDYGSLSLTAASRDVSESGSVTFTVNRTDGSNDQVTVKYATANGSASDADYTQVSGTLTFKDAEIQKSFSVGINIDALAEGTEYFHVTLSDPQGGAVLKSPFTTQVNILDDESCLLGQTDYDVPGPKTYNGAFYCAASHSIRTGDILDAGSVVTVASSGWLMYSAPNIYLYPGFRVEAGGELHLGYPINP